MSKFYASLLVGVLVVVGAASAGAAPVGVNATIQVQLSDFGDFGFTVAGPGGTVSVTGAPGGFTFGGVSGSNLVLPSGLVQTDTLNVPVNATTLVDSIEVSNDFGNGAGTLSIGGATPSEICGDPADSCVSGGGLGGIVPLMGELRVHFSLGFPFWFDFTDLVGAGGAFTAPTGLGPQTGNGGQWTTGIARVATSNSLVTDSGSNDGSTMRLVAPTYIKILSGALEVPAITTLTLTAVPEPGALLLLGAGAAGLALVGHGRRA